MTALAQLLHGTGLFEALSDEEFGRIVAAVTTEAYAAGTVILHEGEVGEAMYVILTGTVQVFTTIPDGQEMVLAKLHQGTYFGEQVLVPGGITQRNASVRAVADVSLAKIRRNDFQRVLAEDSPLKERLLRLGAHQVRQRLMQQSAFFRALALDEDPDSWAEEVVFAAGSTIFRAGDPGDKCYIILSGTAVVYVEEAGARRLLAHLSQGQVFGELALLNNAPRAATIQAEEELRTLSIAGEKFLAMYDRSPQLRAYTATLQKVYPLAKHGFTACYSGTFMDMDCITTLLHLHDGRSLMAVRVIGRDIFTMSMTGIEDIPIETIHFQDPTTGIERELLIGNDRLVGITAQGAWPELGAVLQMVATATRFYPWQAAIFQETGNLWAIDDLSLDEDTDIVCGCMQVSRGLLRNALLSGAQTVEGLADATGASTVCGACRPKLAEMVGRTDWTPVMVSAEIPLTEDSRAFRFTPCGAMLKPALPGQHIVIQTKISGKWVQRPYTLTSPGHETTYYEVTIKREPYGLFSRWMFDNRRDDALIRISSPQGTYYLEAEEKRPIVCLVAGIGVTPALAMCRSVLHDATGQTLHIHYSASTQAQFAYRDELQAAVEQHPNIHLTLWETQHAGRVQHDEIRHLVQEVPEAIFYLCGPTPYLHAVRAHLLATNVSEDRIHSEEFTPTGGPSPKTTDATCPIAHQGVRRGAMLVPPIKVGDPVLPIDETRVFLYQYYYEKGVPEAFEARRKQVEAEMAETGTYVQTLDELTFGARLAWRNSTRCIGRLYWEGLYVRDMRHVQTEEEIFAALIEHVKLATNNGNLRAILTAFAPTAPGTPGLRIWNPQMIRYAGYQQPDGSILGDPAQAALTTEAKRLGWPGGPGTAFDLLPILIQLPGRQPKWFELPREIIKEVPISHPDFAWFADLGLKWYALPMVSNMLLDLGGLHYTAAPFNGWYMGTEIGARNFADADRYNMLPIIATKMNLDTQRQRSLWQDRAIVELNLAVLYSFDKHGVKMLDHHAAADDFMQFCQRENTMGRQVQARWSWIVPPISGSTTAVFHFEQDTWDDVLYKPNFFYQK